MPDTKVCTTCKGLGVYEALISMHDDKTEMIKCKVCDGKGVIYQMTDEEERDYYADYW